jgi:hypothetical protein
MFCYTIKIQQRLPSAIISLFNLSFKSKRLGNPAKGNRWETNNMDVKVSEDGLNASHNIDGVARIVYSMEGFPISGEYCRKDNFPGTVCYYYEVKIWNSARWLVIILCH